MTKLCKTLLAAGWQIERTACGCDGLYAWLKPHPAGGYEMVGCVCHTTEAKLQNSLQEELQDVC